ncbi:uncharacterized protein SCHCODRAFT_02597218 [Schizophyllum commune H4-8]|uniref:Choline/carnitine acyltransferase domain-containing protein n=1 Tax=Schizophyllum commune (strain H4-8 / FGSC 9210) TaxID=578458 RepID=D8PYE3_SCHCM|nr:uncharacterized protein SCHCODRAFT_02597218 [Schizophyllum commune H4-8]KAI5895919.1 hypothetical protein SCHCODRAFT_02597218 [Schizophyllum commune H4-8]
MPINHVRAVSSQHLQNDYSYGQAVSTIVCRAFKNTAPGQKRICGRAKVHADVLIVDSDNMELWLEDSGTDWINNIAQLSPDPYIRMVLQLVYYCTSGGFSVTHETAFTRIFKHGRTETIRSLPCLQVAVSSKHTSIQYGFSGQLQATPQLNREVTGALKKSRNVTAQIDSNDAARITRPRWARQDSRRIFKIGVTSRRPMAELPSISWRPIRSSKQIFSLSWCFVSGSSLNKSAFASREQTSSIMPSKPQPKKILTSLLPEIFAHWTWPCNSIPSLTRHAVFTPIKKALAVSRKHYVADLQRKMDFAVGEVVNELSVGTILEGSTETYKYKSGKY